jgi:membrane-bound lytic murein transglycosylase
VLQLVVVFCAVVFLSGCSSTKPPAKATPATPAEAVKRMPDWYKEDIQSKDFIYGKGTATSQDMNLAADKAAESARLDIGKKIETRMEGLSKRFQEEVGTGGDSQLLDQFSQISKSVVSTTLTGVVTDKSEVVSDNKVFRAYARLKYPVGASALELLNKLKQQEQLYTRFRTSEMSKELDKEVETFEKYKKEHGQE